MSTRADCGLQLRWSCVCTRIYLCMCCVVWKPVSAGCWCFTSSACVRACVSSYVSGDIPGLQLAPTAGSAYSGHSTCLRLQAAEAKQKSTMRTLPLVVLRLCNLIVDVRLVLSLLSSSYQQQTQFSCQYQDTQLIHSLNPWPFRSWSLMKTWTNAVEGLVQTKPVGGAGLAESVSQSVRQMLLCLSWRVPSAWPRTAVEFSALGVPCDRSVAGTHKDTQSHEFLNVQHRCFSCTVPLAGLLQASLCWICPAEFWSLILATQSALESFWTFSVTRWISIY